MAGKDIVEEIVDAPAIAVEKTIATTGKLVNELPGKSSIKKVRDYWHTLGPGLTTGASDDDPSGIATYSQTGAQYGFQLLWLAGFTFPLMAVVQQMCARIGLVTGRGLAANIRLHYPKSVLFTTAILLLAANSFNIGANLGAMAEATRLLVPQLGFGLLVVAFAVISLALQIFTPYAQYAKYLKYLAFVLLAYVFSALLADLNWGQIARAAVTPSLTFSKEQIVLVCAILGTTISPYLFFWQTSQEVEEKIAGGKTTVASRRGASKEEIRDMRIDVWSGMFLSNVVMFFIIAACAAILFPQGVTQIGSAAEAAEALRPFAGEATFYLFAVGIVGTGLLAIPVLAGSASYALSESFGWRAGLGKTLKQAHGFYGVIIIAMALGLMMNFVGLNPIKALIYSAVLNGLIAPVILILIVQISRSQKIMGEHANSRLGNFFGWAIVGMMVVAGLAAIISFFI
jgi:NRAMP (natural resistance-associated macrophage protein)-like metal ion transporter